MKEKKIRGDVDRLTVVNRFRYGYYTSAQLMNCTFKWDEQKRPTIYYGGMYDWLVRKSNGRKHHEW